ncbi:MAG: glycoside hydrolase family 2 TIM barrel-domain containing protein [Bacteroidia bacterium]
MRNFVLWSVFLFLSTSMFAQVDKVKVVSNQEGMKLTVNGNDLMINGMNWDYFPIGTNYSYSLWKQSDDVIKAALDAEMQLLQNMGINAIRQYTGVQPKWIQYIYENYGIYTMLNHSFGRYGLTIDGSWVANTEYSDAATKALLMKEAKEMTERYKNTPGLLMYLLGNENNYGLFWGGAETEDIPIEDRNSTKRARAMYKLFNEATVAMQGIDQSHPVAMCNGDLLFIEIIAEECKDVDIFGTNMYRGESFGDAFQRVKDLLNKPIMFTEFGADAFNAIENQEDQQSQAYYMVNNWKEIYANAAGLGKANNSLGGFTFQFSDGWWKFGQTKNLDVHDNNASWSAGGYKRDLVGEENNMNEEWFGICAKGPTNGRGLYTLYPRAAYYALKDAHSLNPYAEGVSQQSLENHFSNIILMDAVLKARGDKAILSGSQSQKVRLSSLRSEISTYSTGGSLISTPEDPEPNVVQYPNQLGFDHMQSFFVGVEAAPTAGIRANVSFSVLGNVAQNPINEIFYENRGRIVNVDTDQGEVPVRSINRIQLYQADFSWNDKWFDLKGFYRTGHYHWGYEGDFFGLYPEANYGPNIDLYNGEAPFGFEVAGKRELNGLKVAFGPELWWGANPAILLKYSRTVAGIDLTGIFHEDIDSRGAAVSSIAVPQPVTRRATIHAKKKIGKLGIEVGGIWGGSPLVGRGFQRVDETETGNLAIYQDYIQNSDTWGGKAKMTFSSGRINAYLQGAARGLVAFGGADQTQTFTGWRLRDAGMGNVTNAFGGFTYTAGKFQIAPNFQWQKPLVGPIPASALAPGRPRNILDDPFIVRDGNRETMGGELLITYDPTPATWMYEWDNDMAEDAKFAFSLGFVYRHLPTIQDAAVGILGNGRTTFAFAGSAPAQDLWEVYTRIVSKVNPEFGVIANLYGGIGQGNGDMKRPDGTQVDFIERFGGDVRLIYKNIKLMSMVKVNDWGPFDYHRDFNLTYPLQLTADLSISAEKQSWFNLPNTKLGIQYIWRSLDQSSNRYCPTKALEPSGAFTCDPTATGFGNGTEWQIATYLHFNIGK